MCWTFALSHTSPNVKQREEERHLQRLDVLKLVGVPLFDLSVLPRCEEQMGFGDKLQEHDAVVHKQGTGKRA